MTEDMQLEVEAALSSLGTPMLVPCLLICFTSSPAYGGDKFLLRSAKEATCFKTGDSRVNVTAMCCDCQAACWLIYCLSRQQHIAQFRPPSSSRCYLLKQPNARGGQGRTGYALTPR